LQPHPPEIPPPIAIDEPVQNAFFATTTDNNVKPSPLPSTPIKSAQSSTSTKTSSNDDDWSKLPLSAIKRKPITEIMAYLQSKGRDVIGADGRPLPKSKLVEAIFSC
jgi:hypothetical protein